MAAGTAAINGSKQIGPLNTAEKLLPECMTAPVLFCSEQMLLVSAASKLEIKTK
ncbi:MAG TPA: hypothetical protein VHF01_02810 [Candidatus Acidoferrum sp.]|nr:hypothetical protein [Candidatus Acidoferrum sp.]